MYLIYTLNPIALVINVILVILAIASLYYTPLAKLHSRRNERLEQILQSRWFECQTVAILLITGTVLRFYRLTSIPAGLQQDEASIGYEAYILANFGIDRNGWHFPVYPITFGSGGGSPLLVYLNVISTKLFGSNVMVLRGTTAGFGVLTLLLFYLILRKLWNKKTAYTGLLALTLTPWHIIMSRWSLDSNTTPFWFALATLVFIYAMESKKTVTYCLSAMLYAVCMYSYGSSNIVVPIQILLICTYCLLHHKITWKQIFVSAISFIVVVFPLAVFYAINFLDLPAIETPWFSVNRLTAARQSIFLMPGPGFWQELSHNAAYLWQTLTTGSSKELISNAMPGYSTVFAFTFPVTFLGIAESILRIIIRPIRDKRNKNGKHPEADSKTFTLSQEAGTAESTATDKHSSQQASQQAPFYPDFVMLSLLLAGLILGLTVSGRINRMVPLYLPVVYFFVCGLRVLYRRAQVFFAVSLALFLAGAFLFTRAYFGHFNDLSGWIFMPGYGDCVTVAEALRGDDDIIYSTYEGLSSPFMIAMYYVKTDPEVFRNTLQYRDETSEFRVAVAFDHFVYSYPEAITKIVDSNEAISDQNQTQLFTLITGDQLGNDIYIVSHHEEAYFDQATCTIQEYGDYAVVHALP